MARPQTISDEQILSGVERYLSRTADSEWTLADVGAAVGIHAATLIKRFGSKHGLAVALSRRWIAAIPDTVPTGDPLAELRRWLNSLTTTAAAPIPGSDDGAAGRSELALFAADLVDPRLRDLLAEGWAAQLRHTTALIAAVRLSGELARLPWEAEFAATVVMDTITGQRLRSATAASAPITPPNNREAATALALVESWR